MIKSLTKNIWLLPGAILLAGAIFAFDLWMPHGIHGGMLYVVPVFFGWVFSSKRSILFTAALSSLFAFAGFIFSYSDGDLWVSLSNFSLTLLLIWIVAVLLSTTRRAEGQLIDQDKHLAVIVDSAADGIITINERGIVESFNPAAGKIFGFTAREVIGRNVKMLMPDPYRSGHDVYVESYLNTGEGKIIGVGQRELTGLRKDGTEFPLDLGVSEAGAGEKRLFVGIVRDITERKRAEEESIAYLERLRSQSISTRKILHENDLSQTLQTICEEVCRALHADHSMIEKMVFVAPKVYEVNLLASHEMPPEYLEAIQNRQHANGLLLGIMKQEELGVIYPEEDGRVFDEKAHQNAGHKMMIVIPLFVKEEPFGALVLYFLKKYEFGYQERQLAAWFGEMASIAIEKGIHLEEENKRATRLEVTGQIVKAVGSSLEPGELFKTITNEIRRVVPCNRCVLKGLNPGMNSINMWYVESDVPVADSETIGGEVESWFLREIYEPLKSKNVSDLRETNIPWAGHLCDAGFRSVLIIPIPQGEKCIAHLVLGSFQVGAFTAEHEELLASVSSHLGPAIQNATLYDEARDYTEQLQLLGEFSRELSLQTDTTSIYELIGRVGMEVIKADRCGIWIRNEEDIRECVWRKGISDEFIEAAKIINETRAADTAVKDARPIFVPDVLADERTAPMHDAARKEGYRSILHLPLRGEGRIYGTVTYYFNQIISLSERLLETAQTFADQAATAIEKARLYGEVQNRAARLEVLHQVNKNISENLSLDEVFGRIVGASVRLLNGENSSLFLVDEETGEIVLQAIHVETENLVEKKTTITRKNSLVNRMIDSKTGIIVSDTDAEAVLQNPDAHTKLVNAGSFIAVPFLQDGKYVGHINCMSKEKNFFGEDDLKLLAAFASQATIAIQNARLHEETERSKNFLDSVVRDSAEPITIANLEGKLILWNSAAERLFGYTADEVLGRGIRMIVPDDDPDEANEIRAKVKTSGEAVQIETVRKRKDGSLVPVRTTLSPVKGSGGEILAMCAIYNDLTERKKAEAEIRELNEDLEAKVIERTENLVRKSGQISKLNAISRKLSSILGKKEVLDQLARDTADLMKGDRAQLFLLSADRQELRLAAEFTFGASEQRREFIIPVADNPSGIVAKRKRSLIIGDVQEDPNWVDDDSPQKIRLHSYIGVPLYIRGEVAGVLNCLSTKKNVFQDDEIELMEALSAHASVALQNVRVFDELAKKSAQISRLNEISRDLSSLLEGDEVLQFVVRSVVELLGGDRGCLFLLSPDETNLIPKTSYSVVPEPQEGIPELPVSEDGPPSGIVALKQAPVVVGDVQRDESWGEQQWARKENIHSYIGVPLFLRGKMYGVLNCVSKNVDQFKDVDVVLMEALSAQVSVALQNAVSFHELANKSAQVAKLNELNRNLSSYLSQEEVLEQIVRATEELIPNSHSNIYLYDEKTNSMVAVAGENARKGIEASFSVDEKGGVVGWVAKRGESVFIRDVRADPRWVERPWNNDRSVGAYSAIPLHGGGILHGVLVCWLEDVRDWAPEEVDLLSSFASQAVIALENAWSFGELSQKSAQISKLNEINRNLSSYLGQEDVLSQIVSATEELISGIYVRLLSYDEKDGELKMLKGFSSEFHPANDYTLEEGVGLTGWAVENRESVFVPDAQADPRWIEMPWMKEVKIGSYAAILLEIGENILGVLTCYREEVGAWTQDEIDLLNSFASQAAVALENARTFAKLAQKSAQISKLNEVNRNLSSVLRVEEVLDMIIQAAEELMPGTSPSVFLPDEKSDTLRAVAGYIAAFNPDEIVTIHSGEGLGGWAVKNRESVFLTDPASDPRWMERPWNRGKNIGGFGVIPLVMGGTVLGILNFFREECREWTQEEMELLDTFASQAAVAIRNAQLLDEVRNNNRELETTLHELEQMQSQLVESEKMASLGQLVAGIAHEINTPVGISVTAASHLQDRSKELDKCFRDGRIKRSDLERYVNSSTKSTQIILDNLQRAAELIGSFKKVAVDRVSEDRRPIKFREYLGEILLSLRPKLKKTKIDVEVDCDESLVIDSYPGPIAQILTNFVMNSLTHAFDDGDEGEISISASMNGDEVEFRYADTGKGMSEENRSRVFDPFFTTKRGEGGSGLGMHIVYNLVTQTLGGSISCSSEPGKGTEFVLTIPVGQAVAEKV